MACPRCGGPLTEYELDGLEAVSCDSCGYLGVPVEHSGELKQVESWEEALKRFYDR